MGLEKADKRWNDTIQSYIYVRGTGAAIVLLAEFSLWLLLYVFTSTIVSEIP